MKSSLYRRLYHAVFLVSLFILLLSLCAVEFFDEDMEDTILNIELSNELDYFKDQVSGNQVQQWRTERMQVIFLPQGQPESILPKHLQGLPVPFSGEKERDQKTYLIMTGANESPRGRLVVAQDISDMEGREALRQGTLLIIAFIVALIGLVFSRVVAKRLVNPLQSLTHDIQAIEPGKSMQRLSADFDDLEFDEIAKAFNRFLEALDRVVEREKSFVKLASHELRTPIAVMTGAMDILETRDELSEANRRTLARMRRAAMDMQRDVDVLLALARGHYDEEAWQEVSLYQSIRDTLEDLNSLSHDYTERLQLASDENHDLMIRTDPTLIRMLIRNLLQNALKHTDSHVEVWISEKGLHVRDFGAGLPNAISERLTVPLNQQQGAFSESSFGLLIVQLVCEKLLAKIVIQDFEGQGTEIAIAFLSR